MRASRQRERAGSSRPDLGVSSSTTVEPDRIERSDGRHALRRTRPRVIIRDERFDGEGHARIGGCDLIRSEMPSSVDVRSMSAMLDTKPEIDRSPAPADDATTITELLADLRAGRREAFDQILPLVYHELRRAARRELAVRPSDTLSTTALVHELYLKFSARAPTGATGRILGVAAVAMRHILVDRARRRTAEKRGGPHRHVTLDDGP